MKSIITPFLCGILIITCFSCCNKAPQLKITHTIILEDFSSGSGAEFYKNRLYIAGDDSPLLWIGDQQLKMLDTLRLDSSVARRIPKPIKQDLESATIIWNNRKPYLLLAGSGSLTPNRNKALLIDIGSKEKRLLFLDTIYQRITSSGIKSLNIEGLASIPGGILLANRGHKGYPFNHLVYCAEEFWADQDSTEFRIIKLGNNPDTAVFNGVSGMDYSDRSDRLYLTVTTENTYSNHADGEIGKSYLWIIDEISSRKRFTALNPRIVIDLEEMDSRFKGQKIESVAVISESNNKADLALVADNDDGSTSVFIVELNLKSLK